MKLKILPFNLSLHHKYSFYLESNLHSVVLKDNESIVAAIGDGSNTYCCGMSSIMANAISGDELLNIIKQLAKDGSGISIIYFTGRLTHGSLDFVNDFTDQWGHKSETALSVMNRNIELVKNGIKDFAHVEFNSINNAGHWIITIDFHNEKSYYDFTQS